MSADAWRVCPKCGVNATCKRQQAIIKADSLYGKVPVNEWTKLHDAAHAMPESTPYETLREDYEIFMGESGMFYITYQCSCTKCGFKHRFKHEKQVVVLLRGLNWPSNSPK